MRDVAKAARVSQSTVSRVLNGSAGHIPIGDATRQRVLDAVRQLGYHPNLHAGSLRGKKTRMLAMMIADIANPFYHPMVRAVQDVARSHHYDVMITNTDHMRDEELYFCESTIRHPVDGVLMVPYHLTTAELDDLIVRTGVAMVAIGQHISHPLVDVGFADDSLATWQVVTWLISAKRHTRIGFIGVTEDHPAGARRRRAFQKAVDEAGLEQLPDYHQTGDWSAESGQAAMCRLLALPAPPTAVVACNDLMAIGAMEAARQAGRRIPEDVAVVGFDDIPAASWVRPRLSTVAQRPRAMGTILADALFERIHGDYCGPGRRFEIPCHFIEREST